MAADCFLLLAVDGDCSVLIVPVPVSLEVDADVVAILDDVLDDEEVSS